MEEQFESYLARIQKLFHPAPGADAPTPEAADEAAEPEVLPVPEAMTPLQMEPEVWHKLERAAAAGALPDWKLTSRARCLYFTLRGLYAAQRYGNLPLAMAKAEKRMAVEAYNASVRLDALHTHAGQFFKNVAEACRCYSLRPCLETADGMYQAVYRMLPRSRMEENDEQTKLCRPAEPDAAGDAGRGL